MGGPEKMYLGKQIAVVVPAHNEESFIGQVIASVPAFVDLIVVVDDASSDATAQRVREAADERVVLLVNDENVGVGGSVIRGYRRALESGYDVVVKVDGDGQMPLHRLQDLLQPIMEDGYDYAKGNRFHGHTAALEPMPWLRVASNLASTFLTKLASGYWHLVDPQNGFTAISAGCLETIDLDRLHRRYFFENDMLVQLNIRGARVKDVPMPAVYGKEESNMGTATVILTFPVLFFRRFLHRVHQKYVLRELSPIALFLGIGSLLLLWGGGFGLYLWIRSSLAVGQSSTAAVLLAVLPLVLGFQLVLQALVLDIQETPR
ncbi:MAG: glycosyltransferase family 2 protein [Candidatus Bipolaricaulota bacterium]